jgi:hypothetical protein
MTPAAPITETALQRNARLKREAAARSRAYRERKKAERAPDPRTVDAAVTEALAFVLAKYGPLVAARNAGRPLSTASVPVLELLKTSSDILTQAGYNRQRSSQAIADRTASRPDHSAPHNVPSIRPTDDPARIMPPRLWPGDTPAPVQAFRRSPLVDMLMEDDDDDA